MHCFNTQFRRINAFVVFLSESVALNNIVVYSIYMSKTSQTQGLRLSVLEYALRTNKKMVFNSRITKQNIDFNMRFFLV